MLEQVRQRHISRGRDTLVKATEGRMQALKARVERRRLQIEDGRRLEHRKDEICVGLLRLEE